MQRIVIVGLLTNKLRIVEIYNIYIRTLVFACFYTVPRIEGQCEVVGSTTRSLTFGWAQAKSATSYRLVGHSKSASNVTNSITLNGLTPGSRYTFTVWAVGWQGRVSNNITCTGSTGLLEIFLAHLASKKPRVGYRICLADVR